MNWLKKDCEVYREMISALLDDELSAGDKARLRSHLAHCDDCSTLCVAFAAADGALTQTMEDVPEALHYKIMEKVQEHVRGQRMLRLKQYLKPALITAACLVVISAAVLTPMFMWRSGNSGATGGNSAAAPAAASGETSGTTGAMSGGAADETADAGAPGETMNTMNTALEIEGAVNGEGAEDAAEDTAGKGTAFYQSAPSGTESGAPAERPEGRDAAPSPAPSPSPEADKVLMLLELEVSAVEEAEGGGFTAVVLSDSSSLLSPGVRVTVRSPAAGEAPSQSPALQPGDRVMVRYNSLSMIPEGWLVTADSVELI